MSSDSKEEVIRSFGLDEVQSEVGFFKTLFKLFWTSRHICIPAVVTKTKIEEKTSDGKEDHRIEVQPIVKMIGKTLKGDKDIDRPPVKVWPIRILHGGYMVSVPLMAGDTGYIIAGDRDCADAIEKNSEIVLEDKKEKELKEATEKPKYFDENQWEYGFFIPSSWVEDKKRFKDQEEDEKKLIIGTANGSEHEAYISIERETGNIEIHGEDFKVEIPDHSASLIERELIIGYDKETHSLIKWTGYVLSEEEEEGETEPIEIDATDYIQEGDGIHIEKEDGEKAVISSTCVDEITASANVTSGDTTNLTMTATKESGGEKGPSSWKIELQGTVGGGGGGFDGSKFHFRITFDGENAIVSPGAVQIGGFTHFIGEDTVALTQGITYVCVKVDLASGSGGFVSFGNSDDLAVAQADLRYYIFPLYLVTRDGIVTDYRPLPNSGSWETARH